MAQGFEIGKVVTIPAGTELNHGNDEDSDSILVKNPITITIVGAVHDGGIEVAWSGHENLSPLFWHQPEHATNGKLPNAVAGRRTV